jgi:glycosyltransferase involved in cell wall biosynthesis
VRNGKDIILADQAEAFADAVITLLCDSEMRKRYERTAAEAVTQFGWASVAEKFVEVLAGAVQAKSSNRGSAMQIDPVRN